jgi:zinc protease
MRASFLMFLALGCGPKTAPVELPAVQVDHRSKAPGPSAPRAWELPVQQEGALSNGLRVAVVENHELPLVYVQVVFNTGGWTDPVDRPGLASVSVDMLNEGAGGMSAAELSGALRKLATSLGTGAGLDGATVSMSCLRKNLEPSLDLMATVLLRPDFPKSEWELLQKQRLQDLQAAREDPRRIAVRVWDRVLYGERYAGLNPTEAAYKAMSPAEMKAWTEQHLVPANAMILVGGDTSLSEITPLLEARFGGWKGGAAASPPARDAVVAKEPEATTVYLVDTPGKSQSVLKAGRSVGYPDAPDWEAFSLANRSVGGAFTSRINMNLREEKGWTYGARSGSDTSYAPSVWQVSTSVRTDATGGAVSEVLRELRESLGGRPLTEAELEDARGSLLGTWPLQFENPGFLLGQTEEAWRYGRPADWMTGWPERVRAADLAAAQAAWKARIDPERLVVLVVGDAAAVRPQIAELGLPIVDLDVDGKAPAAPPTPKRK